MAGNTLELGHGLKQYMINLLNSLGKEVDEQFGKWGKERVGFLSLLCYAQQQAIDEQLRVLKEAEEERQKAFERSLFVLELLSAGATAWLGAALEQKLGPKLFFKYEDNLGPVLLPKFQLKKIANHYESKIFGDMGHDLADMLSKMAGENFSSPKPLEMDARKIAQSPDAEMFASNLFHAVDEQRLQALNTINKLAQDINNSVTFGDALVKRLRRDVPRFDQLALKDQELAGHKMINDLLDLYRRSWADKWLYYGNDPPKLPWPRVARDLEKQIWVVWILQQRFHLEDVSSFGSPKLLVVTGGSGPVLNDIGGFASAIKTSPIVERLFELNVPVMQTIIMEGSPTTQEQVDRLNNWAINIEPTWLQSQMSGVPRQLKPVDQIW